MVDFKYKLKSTDFDCLCRTKEVLKVPTCSAREFEINFIPVARASAFAVIALASPV